MPRPSPPPSLAPLSVATSLTGLAAEFIADAVAAGRVRSDRVKGRLFVCLDDLDDLVPANVKPVKSLRTVQPIREL